MPGPEKFLENKRSEVPGPETFLENERPEVPGAETLCLVQKLVCPPLAPLIKLLFKSVELSAFSSCAVLLEIIASSIYFRRYMAASFG